MEGQDKDTAAAAQPQRFQRYRSVRRAPKQNVPESVPDAFDTTVVQTVPVRLKGTTTEASKISEMAAPTRQRQTYAPQATTVKDPFLNDSSKRTRPEGITKPPADYMEESTVKREAPIRVAMAGNEYEKVAHMASANAPPSKNRRSREEYTTAREGKKMDMFQPGFDAPRSAVNAGDRHVYVTCNKSTIAFPITPFTTALDLIQAAATAMPLEKLDSTSAVLWEDYRPYLLERPLRRYESIREVMNSWDGDEQNKFLLTPSQSGKLDESLDAQYVPAHQPGDSSYYMYHTHKNARWSKRVVTLHADGQVTINKEGAKEKDQQNICHLSDFDIYHISPRYKKVIRPPRPICFGIKSQQKRAVFYLNEDNFMQFFSTKDERLAKSFYQDVQRWRSWHLVHVMGKTQKSQSQEISPPATKPTAAQRHPKRTSIGLAGSDTGFNNPLISTNRLAKLDHRQVNVVDFTARSQQAGEDKHGDHRSLDGVRPLHRPKTQPPISFPRKLTKDPMTGAPTTSQRRLSEPQNNAREAESEPFAVPGLLGTQYQERLQAQQQHPPASPPAIVPPQTFHLSLQHPNSSPTRAASIRTAKPSAHRTSPSRKGSPPPNLPKPLVDLTPKFYEAPQHVKRERRILPERLPSSGLVDIATTPEVAINVPSATAWKRPETTNAEGIKSGALNGHVQRHSHDQPSGQTSNHRRSNSRVRHRQTVSGERPDQVATHPLQRSPVKAAPTVSQPPMPSSYRAPTIPANTSSGQPLARRGTLKMVGGPLNRSSRKKNLGDQDSA